MEHQKPQGLTIMTATAPNTSAQPPSQWVDTYDGIKVSFYCPKCGFNYWAAPIKIGTRGKCQCGGIMDITRPTSDTIHDPAANYPTDEVPTRDSRFDSICPYCLAQKSILAPACPHCGRTTASGTIGKLG